MSGGFDVQDEPGELFMKPFAVALGEMCGLINRRVPMSTYWGSAWLETLFGHSSLHQETDVGQTVLKFDSRIRNSNLNFGKLSL